VGRLLGKSKWEKPLADWIMATGVGFLRPENHDLEAESGREMMDGALSHSSEIKLLTFRRTVRFFLCFSFPSLSFHLTVISTMLYLFVLSRLFFLFTSGASSPEWVKPAAEGGGLLGICFLFSYLLFVICSSVVCLLCFCLHSHHG
jgi:hypothetical protein